eukprot:SM000014S00244  [mRNA]  locus=s14:222178:228841:+ [translate_table: standard]
MAAAALLLALLLALAAPLGQGAGGHHRGTQGHHGGPRAAALSGSAAAYACGPGLSASAGYAFCDKRLPIAARVHALGLTTASLRCCGAALPDLIARMTLAEKVSQLGSTSPPVPRLGIAAYQAGAPTTCWWNEALHGVAKSPGVSFAGPVRCATTFPQVIGLAAGFNPVLWNQVGQAVSTEARAMHNLGAAGLTFWAPNLNIFRDPRWGRGQETPGEDPLVASKYAAAYVTGLQGGFALAVIAAVPVTVSTFFARSEDIDEASWRHCCVIPGNGGGELKVSACCKHFTAYDLDNWEGNTRFTFNAWVTDQDKADTYNMPFKACVQAGASSVMCSYNRVNGVPSCASREFLTQTVRQQWGFQGYVVSDCGAVNVIKNPHQANYSETAEGAIAAVLRAGMDVECGTTLQKSTESAVAKGFVTGKAVAHLSLVSCVFGVAPAAEQVDEALARGLTVQMRLGMFDGNPQLGTWGAVPAAVLGSPAHRELALTAARQSVVLLLNRQNVLPIAKIQKSIAVIGPHADATSAMLGNYEGVACQIVTPAQGLGRSSPIKLVKGCADVACTSPETSQQIQVAATAAVAVCLLKLLQATAAATVLVMGLDATQEREGLDRTSLLLPGFQSKLITTVAAAARGPVILVLLSGGPLDITAHKANKNIDAILWAGYPGETGGQAIADIIFGAANPVGRLPMTWYPQGFTAVQMTDMRLRPDRATSYPGRTHRFYTGKVVFPFGYGLSYTSFVYSNFDITPGPDSSLHVSVKVTNSGGRAGQVVVLLYAAPPKAGLNGNPLRNLVAFQQILVKRGKSKVVRFVLKPSRDLVTCNPAGRAVLMKGTHILSIGSLRRKLKL